MELLNTLTDIYHSLATFLTGVLNWVTEALTLKHTIIEWIPEKYQDIFSTAQGNPNFVVYIIVIGLIAIGLWFLKDIVFATIGRMVATLGIIIIFMLLLIILPSIKNDTPEPKQPPAKVEQPQATDETPKEPAQVDSSTILGQLITYTTNSEPGPTGNYYWESGPAQVNTQNIDSGKISNQHDNNGRPSTAYAKLTYKMWSDSAGLRQGSPLSPAGWPDKNPYVSIKYSTGNHYNGYMYNRSHSIGDSLGGKATYASKDNFTTGTRPQNVGANNKGGMRFTEMMVEDYWKSNPNSKTVIEYEVIPVYNEKETIPRGSIVNVKSSDNALDSQVIIINSVEGYDVDYNNGHITEK